MKTLTGCLGSILLQVGAYILNGFVLKLLWGWFLVQLGLPQLGLVQAIGIGLTVGYLTNQYIKQDVADWEDMLAHQFALPVAAVIAGWAVQLFM